VYSFKVLQGRYAVAWLPPGSHPDWVPPDGFTAVTRTSTETSVVCPEDAVPEDVKAQKGWRILGLVGPFDFALVGVLASVINPLAAARVPIFAISTFETDYILIPEEHFARALTVLQEAGHHRA